MQPMAFMHRLFTSMARYVRGGTQHSINHSPQTRPFIGYSPYNTQDTYGSPVSTTVLHNAYGSPVLQNTDSDAYGSPQSPVLQNTYSDAYGSPQSPVLQNTYSEAEAYGSPQSPVLQNTYSDAYGSPQSPVLQNTYSDTYGSPQSSVLQNINSDVYGSPQSPVLQNTDSYPNALHEIVVTNSDDHGNVDILLHSDNYANTNEHEGQGDVFNQNTVQEFPLTSENENFLDTSINNNENDNLLSNLLSQSENLEAASIPQMPSAGFPDQNNPEKYFNNNQDILEQVINTPVFYNDAQKLKENSSPKFVIFSQ